MTGPADTYVRLRAMLGAADREPVPPPDEASRPPRSELDRWRADPQRRIGEFVVVSEVGKGGMGVVYKAWDERLHRPVAVKVLRTDGAAVDAARFEREARILARLDHPGVVGVHGLGTHHHASYIVMEWVDGISLQEWRAAGPRDPHEVCALLAEVARALEHVHAQGILHRDVKPSNILLARPRDPAGRSVPKLIDFGIARNVLGTVGPASLSGIGTPDYMAPEQARGDTTRVSPRSDVYGLGATLYHLLAGRPPVHEPARSGSPDPPRLVPPGRFRSGLDRRLEGIVLRAMDPDPAGRHTDMAALRSELESYLAGAETASSSLLQRLARGVILPMALLAAAGLAGFAVHLFAARDARRAGEQRRLAERAFVLYERATAFTAPAAVRERDEALNDAEAEFDRVLAAEPDHALTRVLRASVRRRRADARTDDAGYRSALADLVALNPAKAAESQAATERRAILSRIGDPGDAGEFEPAAQARALAAWRSGDVEAASRHLADLSAALENADSHRLRGQMRIAQGNYEAGARELERAVPLEPYLRPAWRALIEAHLVWGNAADARRMVDLVDAGATDPLWSHYDALLKMRELDRTTGTARLKRLHEELPDEIDVLGDLAVFTLVEGDRAGARRLLEAYRARVTPGREAHARYHFIVLETQESPSAATARALAELAAEQRAAQGEGFDSESRDWADPWSRAAMMFWLTAPAIQKDPLLEPLRADAELWEPVAKAMGR